MSALAADAAAPLIEVGRLLAAADVPALILSEPADLPSAALLVHRRRARAAEVALDRGGWRWRVGGDGAWRLTRRRRYVFDGGFHLTVHAALPAGPLPAITLLQLERALWVDSSSEDGLARCRREPLLVYLGVQIARGTVRSPGQLAEVLTCAAEVTDWGLVWRLARKVGVSGTLRAVLADRAPPAEARTDASVGTWGGAIAWRVADVLRRRGRPQALWDAVIGEPWRHATTRCRFCGLELLAGPGTFLPRGVSELLVDSAVERMAGPDRAFLVDVGTGCGAVALALARRRPDARVRGVDVDTKALSWARRNRRRCGLHRVDFASGSLLDPVPASWEGCVSVVVANVPCIPPDSFEGASDAPEQAYVGTGPDGLDLHRRLAEQARDALRPGGWLLVQLAPLQWEVYRQSLEALGYQALGARGGDVAVIGAARWPGQS